MFYKCCSPRTYFNVTLIYLRRISFVQSFSFIPISGRYYAACVDFYLTNTTIIRRRLVLTNSVWVNFSEQNLSTNRGEGLRSYVIFVTKRACAFDVGVFRISAKFNRNVDRSPNARNINKKTKIRTRIFNETTYNPWDTYVGQFYCTKTIHRGVRL